MKASRIADGAEFSLDDARRYHHFLQVKAGPARLELSLTAASALHDLLNDYFGPPTDTVEVVSLSDDEPIAYLPTAKREAA